MSFGLLIWLVFLACIFVQLIQFLVVFPKLVFYVEPMRDILKTPATIIIAAKNEAFNLTQNLPHILNQEHAEFQVLVVDDGSTDGTWEVLQDLMKGHANLSVIRIESSLGKKNAIETAIHASKHEVLVFTDADCKPVSKYWLSEMVACFEPGKEIVIGYGPYGETTGFLNKLIRFDTSVVAHQYMSFALWGMPYMCVGRNMAYKKELFYRSGKFDSHKHIKSGDDDLFIMNSATATNTFVCLHPDTFVYSPAKETWKEWIHQKTRHTSTIYSYKQGIAVILSLMNASHFGLHVFLAFAFLWGFGFKALFFYGLLMMNKILIYKYLFERLRVKGLLFWLPILELIHTFAYFLILFHHLVRKKITWK